MAAATAQRTRWGRSRFGGGTGALLMLSMLCGALLAAAAGALFGWLVASTTQVLGSILFACMVWPVTSALAWVCFVDVTSLRDTVENAEDTVENHWYDKAASATFTDLLLVLGIGGVIFTFAPIEANIGLTLVAVIILVTADFALRYRMLSREQG